MRAVFSAEARADLRDARAFYSAVDARLAQRFARAVDTGVERVLASPTRWPERAQGVRRCLVERFPYSLVFRIDGEIVRFIALQHHRRQPRDWTGQP